MDNVKEIHTPPSESNKKHNFFSQSGNGSHSKYQDDEDFDFMYYVGLYKLKNQKHTPSDTPSLQSLS